jgi:adenine-specific DNA-methyltransferase
MALKMFDALLPYFGGKRKLCPVIFRQISKYLPREKWQKAVFVDAFLGSGAVSLYAKAQGFRIICNDIAQRSWLAGKVLIENNLIRLSDEDIHRLFLPNSNNNHFIEQEFVPDVFTKRHAVFLDNAFANAERAIDKYLLLKYIFCIRPYSKFSSPNAFNRPFEEGRYDEIKQTYAKHIKDNLKTPLAILKIEKERVNAGIFSNGLKNEVYKKDVFDFIKEASGSILYLDPPYAGTLSYESEYGVLDRILGESKSKSRFSSNGGIEVLDELLVEAGKFPLWVISFGNAGGKNELSRLVEIVSKYRRCEAKEFIYRHCEAMASEEHKKKSREWLIIGYNAN